MVGAKILTAPAGEVSTKSYRLKDFARLYGCAWLEAVATDREKDPR